MHDATGGSRARSAHAVFGSPPRGALDAAPWLTLAATAALCWPFMPRVSSSARALLLPAMAVVLSLPVCWSAGSRRARRAMEVVVAVSLGALGLASGSVGGGLQVSLAMGLLIVLSAMVTAPMLFAMTRAARRPTARNLGDEALLLSVYGALTFYVCDKTQRGEGLTAAPFVVGALTVLVAAHGLWHDLRARATARAVLRGEVAGWRALELAAVKADALAPSPWVHHELPWLDDTHRVVVSEALAVGDGVYRQPEPVRTVHCVVPLRVDPVGAATVLLSALLACMALAMAPAVASLTR